MRNLIKPFVLACLLSTASQLVGAQVSPERLLNAEQEPESWLLYGGDYDSQRHTDLDQITRDNVDQLELKWVWQNRAPDGASQKFEATPLVVDGVMYTVAAPNNVVAIDPVSGRLFWIYNYTPSLDARLCCGRVNRGLAMHGNSLFMGTIDGKLVKLDARKGEPEWIIDVAPPELGYALTLAPLIIGDKVIVGPAGGEYGIRGFIAAYDVNTGEELWRFHTVPGPGEPGFESWEDPEQEAWKTGGGSIWQTGSYDAAIESHLLGRG